MLIRLFRLIVAPDAVKSFLNRFDEAAPQIRTFSGCHHLELWCDVDNPSVFTTHSHWESEEALEQYRSSDLFRATWSELKPLFSARPRAHSYTVARSSDTVDAAAAEAK
jgi:quinol monooxygenase YgiN